MNEALKSIQNKNIKSAQVIPIPIVLLQSKRKKMFINHIAISVGLIVFCIVFFIVAARFILKTQNAVLVKQTPSAVSIKKSDFSTAAPVTGVPLAMIKGVSINVKDNITEIIFSLNQSILYRLSADSLSNKVNIVFDHAQFVATLPDFLAMNTAISDVDYKNNKEDAVFSISLLPNSTVRYVSLSDDKKHPELIVAIEDHALKNSDQQVEAQRVLPSSKTFKAVRSNTTQDQYAEIMNGLKDNPIDDTFLKLNQLVEKRPDFKEARVSYAALLIEHNRYDLALQVLDRGLKMQDDYLPYVELKARTLMMKNQSELALDTMQEHSPDFASHPRFYELMAVLHEQLDQHQEAIDIYKNLIALDGSLIEWWAGLGNALEKIGDIDNARFIYKKALTLNVSNVEIKNHLRSRLISLESKHAAAN